MSCSAILGQFEVLHYLRLPSLAVHNDVTTFYRSKFLFTLTVVGKTDHIVV